MSIFLKVWVYEDKEVPKNNKELSSLFSDAASNHSWREFHFRWATPEVGCLKPFTKVSEDNMCGAQGAKM